MLQKEAVIVTAQDLYLLKENVVVLPEVGQFLLPQILLPREVDLDCRHRHLKLQLLIGIVVVRAEMLPQMLPQMLSMQPGKIELDPLQGRGPDRQVKIQVHQLIQVEVHQLI